VRRQERNGCWSGRNLIVYLAPAMYITNKMGPDGRWTLAPAFDVTWAYGGTWSKTHQMTARGKDDDFTRDDRLAVGRAFDVPKGDAEILEEVESALGLLEPRARAAELAPEWINRVEALFRHFV
jgi:serine/threonine-protein kinase HipA